MAVGLHYPGSEEAMFVILAILLALAWLFGFVVFHVTAAAIHILIIAAVVALALHFIFGARGRRTVP
ncbi:MAG TPA: hypothetical protein VLX92_22170 [Kofleriaceae bacterium]|nr:hypothetical protein [Kofleriaceae bacterium]